MVFMYVDLPAGISNVASQLTFEHSSSFNSDGVEFTGNNGFSVEDNYSCGNIPCGGFTYTGPTTAVAEQVAFAPMDLAQLAFQNSSSSASDGSVFTGNNGYTVTDSYSCPSGCGGFTIGSTYPAVADHSQGLLEFQNSSSYSSDGAIFTGNNGFTVNDTFTCGGNCGGYSVGGTSAGAVAQQIAPIAMAPQPTTRSTPGQFVLCGHAMVLGAFEATVLMGSKVAKGEEVTPSMWSETFSEVSEKAASSVSPFGGFVLKNHVLKN